MSVRSPRTERLQREATFKELLKKCKLVKHCPHCGGVNGQVKCALFLLLGRASLEHEIAARAPHSLGLRNS